MDLARVNNILTIAIVVINLFIFCMPFVPAALFWAKHNFTGSVMHLQEEVDSDKLPSTNRLIIPSIMANQEVHQGADATTLNKGLWLEPSGALPGNGMAVISGHRFTYDDLEGAFYNLDKVKTGDKIALYWDGQKYLYSVDNKYVVGADYQLAPSDSDKLVLYTCTPIWNPTERLIVVANRQLNGGEL